MEVRLAEIKDIKGISNLYNDFFIYNANQQPQYYKQAFETGTYPKSVIESNSEDIFVAVDNGAIIGMLHIVEEATPPFDCFIPYKYATIIDLFITEDYRRKGIGDLLFKSAKEWSNSRNLDYIELNVLAQNQNGIQFYQRENFEAVSQIMRCKL